MRFSIGFFNAVPFQEHLWYLSALLYILIFVIFVTGSRFEKIAERIMPFLLIPNLVLGMYSEIALNAKFELCYTRNFLLTGIPCFYIGTYCTGERKVKYKRIIIFLYFLGIGENVAISFLGNGIGDITVVSIIIAFSLLECGISYNNGNDKLISMGAILGRKYSALIYIIHPIIITLWGEYCPFNNKYIRCVLPFFVFFASITLAMICKITHKTFRKFKKVNTNG